jgi:glycosyltransferase involved in cell wall biosynthesis
MLGLPVLITIHGTDINTYKSWWESGKEGILNKGYPNKLLNITKDPRVHSLAVSQSIKDRAIEFGIPEEKISVEYIGVDVERFKTSGLPLNKRSNKILFVGRMIENKGPLVLLDALKSVINKVPDATLTMIGDGPLLEEAKKVADEYALPVNFLGAQPTEKVIDELNQSKVFCLPSYTLPSGKSEGMPIVTLEAQSCGVPVVTSARGASTEGIIDGVTGFRFKEMCIEELSHRLVNVLVDEAFMLTASESCRDFICDRFDINLCNQSLERIYDEHTLL